MSLSQDMSEETKKQARRLRMRGYSYGEINRQLQISPSTLSGWFNAIQLSPTANGRLAKIRSKALADARNSAALIRRERTKKIRQDLRDAVAERSGTILAQKKAQEMILAAIYLGEGFKRCSVLGLGNSNPSILITFIRLLRLVYGVENSSLKCFLYLRYDQDAQAEIRFWSNTLQVPTSNFGKPQFDKRTLGKKTHTDYHGVCAVYCYKAEIEKRLTAAQNVLLQTFSGG